MGKNRHSKDRLFITATEWATEYGGKKSARQVGQPRPLPFSSCALSLASFENPVLVGSNGIVYDFENIVPFLQKHKKDPATGEPATTKQIVRLNMDKNSDGLWQCPVTCKVFTDSSHVVAIKSTGNVYAYDAVLELNIRPNNFTDLLTSEPFKKSDIITLQNPQDPEVTAKRDVNSFVHLKQLREENIEARKSGSSSNFRHNPTSESIMKEIQSKENADRLAGKKRKTLEDIAADAAVQRSEDVADILAMRPLTEDVNPGQISSDGKASRSLTSSAAVLWTSSETRLATAEEIREAKWKVMRKVAKKGYVQLQTTAGNLNIELHCDIAMRTCWNFIALCKSGYYTDVSFHRLIRGFMVQGGDPTGTGSGGESAFKSPFKDEFDSRLTHSGRGILSMANSGMNSNGSQFFFTFKATPHLDLKHTVFGRVVGGLATLDKMEEIPADKKDRPTTEIKILNAIVFTDPTVEAEAALREEVSLNMQSRLAAAAQRGNALSGAAAGAVGADNVLLPVRVTHHAGFSSSSSSGTGSGIASSSGRSSKTGEDGSDDTSGGVVRNYGKLSGSSGVKYRKIG